MSDKEKRDPVARTKALAEAGAFMIERIVEYVKGVESRVERLEAALKRAGIDID